MSDFFEASTRFKKRSTIEYQEARLSASREMRIPTWSYGWLLPDLLVADALVVPALGEIRSQLRLGKLGIPFARQNHLFTVRIWPGQA